MTKTFGLLFGACLIAPSALAEHPVAFRVQVLAIDSNEGCAIADFDNDGYLDVSAGRSWYRNPGNDGPWTPRPLRLIGERNGYSQTNGEFAYDVDGDGWTDVIAGSFWDENVYWYRNPGKVDLERGALWQQNVLIETGQNTNEVGAFVQVAGGRDSRPEWVANQWNKNKPTIVWHADDQGTYSGHTIGPKSGHGIGFGDINNDGRDDILTGSGWYERPEGDPFAGAWAFHADWDIKLPCPFIVQDLNGDGRADLFWGSSHDYGLFVWFGEGVDEQGKLKFREIKIDEPTSQLHAMLLADLDGDGRAEMITGKRVRGHNGRDPGSNEPPQVIYYSWDEGFENVQRHVAADGTAGIGLQIRTADLDGDGDLEIVVPGKDGTQILWNLSKE